MFAVICLALFLEGWNLGATGPLIPAIQKYYNVIFLSSDRRGFVCASMLNVYLAHTNLGFGQLVVLGHVCQLVSWIIQAPAPPFPLFVISYFLGGFGFAMQDAQLNGFVAALEHHKETRVGIIHAFFGLGAFAVPLVSTKFADSPHWSLHYLTSIGVASTCIVCSSLVFRFRKQDEILEEIGQPPRERGTNEQNHYRQIMSQRAVHVMAFFILIYVGIEVTLGGWIVTYIINVRGGGPSSGYISSGFFGGLTLGRVGLLWVNRLIGERSAVFLYGILIMVLEITIWKIPSLTGNAVTVSFVGAFLGPMFPIVINHASKVLPHWLLTGSIGWITGFGQTGSAVLPLVTGTLAQRAGIWTLHPLSKANRNDITDAIDLVPCTRSTQEGRVMVDCYVSL
ncbi:MFS general substrate transporter [Thelephora ganbajun]|uniref:MFS general substrate transporter n=1 Tax=Thelephora ganbajun TaxID=370292 RepID=A0ACB6ZL26_THEGA|nr:MFS general substrate transporter [Thelephora ganbajun]